MKRLLGTSPTSGPRATRWRGGRLAAPTLPRQTHQNDRRRARGSRLAGRGVVLFSSPESASSARFPRPPEDHPGLAQELRPHQATAGLHQLAASSALPSVQSILRDTGNRTGESSHDPGAGRGTGGGVRLHRPHLSTGRGGEGRGLSRRARPQSLSPGRATRYKAAGKQCACISRSRAAPGSVPAAVRE